MGIFKKKQPKEKNEIENKVLKENIANAALAQLSQGDDYKSLAYTKVEFGYLFDIENHGIEALFKIITDKDTFYFAVQGANLLRLTLTEELFSSYVDGFFATRQQ
ncbi:hypothetical protein [Eshraghiella crossota]|uniref:hypothetical protein n=1 Tax=Eshraghiella crossota TaxID=45851 RepID=UPI003FD80CC5